ncbi:MAG: hypothetical protein HQK77_14780 [Desulfobacterales bacterium]|nr:hypothetical protein [Desulfobacterales bacterium]
MSLLFKNVQDISSTSTRNGFSQSNWPQVSFQLMAIVTLVLAIESGIGTLSLSTFVWLAFALICILGAIGARTLPDYRIFNIHPVYGMISVAMTVQICQLLINPLHLNITIDRQLTFTLIMGSLSADAVLSGMLCASTPWLGSMILPLLICVQTVLGITLIEALPKPGIDVLMFQQDSSAALLQGINPYTIQFPDPYPPNYSAIFYGQGVSVNGVLQFGYPYMPVTLMFNILGHLMGDIRYAGLIAIILSSMLISYAKPGRIGTAAAALLLVNPFFPLMVMLAWTESYSVFLLSLVWFCHCRAKKLLPFIVGLLIVSKQYMVLTAPAALLLLDRPYSLRQIFYFIWQASLTGLIITLPFFLWDPKAFWESVIVLQFHQPFRTDSLSFLVWINPANPTRWIWIPFVASIIVMVLAFLRSNKCQVGYFLTVAATLAFFFALNKQGCVNYYYLVIASLCCSLAENSSAFNDVVQSEITYN